MKTPYALTVVAPEIASVSAAGKLRSLFVSSIWPTLFTPEQSSRSVKEMVRHLAITHPSAYVARRVRSGRRDLLLLYFAEMFRQAF